MADSPRIDELRRRVDRDPSGIAFAVLAEEYRRAGRYWEAIETCRAGLAHHPMYVSARVTLGRALIEVGELEQARAELAEVLKAAPENLAAIRALAEIHHRTGDAPPPDLELLPIELLRQDRDKPTPAVTPPSGSPGDPGLDGLDASLDLRAFGGSPMDDAPRPTEPWSAETGPGVPAADMPPPPHPALAGLERFLQGILTVSRERGMRNADWGINGES